MKEKTRISKQSGDWIQETGPLKALLKDPNISEIMVNRYDRIFYEKNGVIHEASDLRFESAGSLMRTIQAIVVSVGKEVNRRNPCLDARMQDGSRLNIVVPPVALDGPSITIRKFLPQSRDYRNLIENGTLDDKSLYFLVQAVKSRLNIVISGGTGCGKTTMLGVLSSFISSKERLITIEDTAELYLKNKNLVRMESRPPVGNEPGVSIQDLVRNALRMRPDRLIVGECRGPEAWDMLIAMNTGHEGSMTTLHANSAIDTLRRMESMVLRAGLEAPLSMIKDDIASTINLVVQIERQSDGRRQVVEIVEVNGRDSNGYNLREIFRFDRHLGLRTVGVVPAFVSKQRVKNVHFSEEFFEPDHKVKMAG